MKEFSCEIATPQKLVAKKVSQVQAPSIEGEIGVLANHAPLMCLLKAGRLVLYGSLQDEAEAEGDKNIGTDKNMSADKDISSSPSSNQGQKNYFVFGGALNVQKNKAQTLADYVLELDGLTKEILEDEIKKARESGLEELAGHLESIKI